MNITAQEQNKFVIYDNILSQEEYSRFWTYTQKEHYVPAKSGGWNKVWRLEDGEPLVSKMQKHTEGPFEDDMEVVRANVMAIAERHPELVGDYKDVTFRNYLYGRGSRISWHNDPGYNAACIFYTHQEWSPFWGGELMLADLPDLQQLPKEVIEGVASDDDLEKKWVGRLLNIWGVGRYITPLPNRMVLTKGDVWHATSRVDPSAGDHLRTSVVCFFEQ